MATLNSKGKMVIPPQFEDAYLFIDGLAYVKKDGKDNFIDDTGSVVLGPFDNSYSSGEGLAMVYIEKTGEIIWRAER